MVGPDADLIDVAREIGRHGIGAVPVVDDEQRLLGLVSTSDLVGLLHERPGLDGKTARDAMSVEPPAIDEFATAEEAIEVSAERAHPPPAGDARRPAGRARHRVRPDSASVEAIPRPRSRLSAACRPSSATGSVRHATRVEMMRVRRRRRSPSCPSPLPLPKCRRSTPHARYASFACELRPMQKTISVGEFANYTATGLRRSRRHQEHDPEGRLRLERSDRRRGAERRRQQGQGERAEARRRDDQRDRSR